MNSPNSSEDTPRMNDNDINHDILNNGYTRSLDGILRRKRKLYLICPDCGGKDLEYEDGWSCKCGWIEDIK